MTREQEIEQAMKASVAETIYASGWGVTPQATDLLECAFTKGAMWADRTMIEKAIKWLKENTNWEFEYDECGRNLDFGKLEEFRKAMQE